jgi:hypothetical protein
VGPQDLPTMSEALALEKIAILLFCRAISCTASAIDDTGTSKMA